MYSNHCKKSHYIVNTIKDGIRSNENHYPRHVNRMMLGQWRHQVHLDSFKSYHSTLMVKFKLSLKISQSDENRPPTIPKLKC